MLKTDNIIVPRSGPMTSARLNIKEYMVKFFSISFLSETKLTNESKKGIIIAVANPEIATNNKNSIRELEKKYPNIVIENKIIPIIINFVIWAGFTLMLTI